jgi:hypothetical protein
MEKTRDQDLLGSLRNLLGLLGLRNLLRLLRLRDGLRLTGYRLRSLNWSRCGRLLGYLLRVRPNQADHR